ncbi:hypothetical protein AX14_006058 [Amanita brunnescens Koide BX004]|nr:hypothetical protein AX14_006058 [Amanita brunnescens Koide BX004]
MIPKPRETDAVVIGILALQGAFAEHQAALRQLPLSRKISAIQVRTVSDLEKCSALIIPGGESTTIALLAKLSGLLEPLRAFVKTKPVWGTCAGAILLSQAVDNSTAKRGGQELLGGMSITISRNGWGSQIESFEAPLQVMGLRDPGRPFTGVFIRAPVIVMLTPSPDDPPIEVIARLPAGLLPQGPKAPVDDTDPQTIVALRQGLHFLTTFHPELTRDGRFHEYFVKEVVLSRMT